jgi:hypothetical protein
VPETRLPETRRARLLSLLALIALVGTAVIGGAVLRARAADAEAERLAAARFELAQDVRAVRVGYAAPARDGRRAAASLRVLLAETLTGTDRTPEALSSELDRRIRALRDAADRLELASDRPMPEPPSDLSTDVTDPLFARLDGLDDQARTSADHLRAAADVAERLGTLAHRLTTAASEFAATAEELPDSDDPDAVLAAWSEEADRLAPYRETAEDTLDAAESRELEELAEAHLAIIGQLAEAAEDARAALADERFDAYNEDREASLAAVEELHAQLVAAIDSAVRAAVAPVEAAEERALGVLNELEQLRRETPVGLATS